MSSHRIHADIVELLPAAALGILDRPELEPVLAHVRSCPECTRELQALRELVGSLALALATEPLEKDRAAHLRTRVMNRTRRRPALPRVSRAIIAAERWSGWMVAAGLATLLLSHHAVHEPLDYGWLTAAVLGVALVILGLYARLLRKRVIALMNILDEGAATCDESSRSLE